ncbi:MAG: ion transporter [Thermoleophilia bacterium]|nr:ion transporter [Thermoleophilia bacterium]
MPAAAPPRNALARLVDSGAFTAAVVGTIAANAVVLGLQTYEGIVRRFGDWLELANALCLGIFLLELGLRVASYWPRPLGFFRSGWNVFDFVVILSVFLPGVSQSTTTLRLLRLLRVVRLVRVLPELRVLLLGVWRSIPPLASIAAVTAMILFVYGMVGWIWFGDELPRQWGDIGRAMLTLFVMLTLENFPQYMDAAMDVEPWAWVYYVSFILVAAFIVLNVLIGIVLNAMEEARELERRRALRERHGATGAPVIDPEAHAPVAERIAILRNALDELELELAVGASAERPPR